MLLDQFICIIQLTVEEDPITTPGMNIRDNVNPFLHLKRLAHARTSMPVSVSGDCWCTRVWST